MKIYTIKQKMSGDGSAEREPYMISNLIFLTAKSGLGPGKDMPLFWRHFINKYLL